MGPEYNLYHRSSNRFLRLGGRLTATPAPTYQMSAARVGRFLAECGAGDYVVEPDWMYLPAPESLGWSCVGSWEDDAADAERRSLMAHVAREWPELARLLAGVDRGGPPDELIALLNESR